MKSFPLITAHTGCMDTPTNSLLSIETGISYGADIIEDDIHVTRDGILVLSHDDTVRLENGTESRISGMTFNELRDGVSTLIPTLEQALELVRNAGKIMNLDLKTDLCIAPVSDLVERLGLHDQVFLTGCEYESARKAQEHNPRLFKLLNADVRIFKTLSYTDAIRKTCDHARSAGCLGLNMPYQLVQPPLLEIAADYSLPVYIWTVNEEGQIKRFAEMGVRSITTKNVAAAARVKREVTGIGL
ncbi:glycerophosphodiester phosphodiesterase [Cohnella luojiensis]|uniref:Glycerophosphodiester phosphodiesterase n=1 Tax=Cohnella luojiensis TaxID=652876 RepID=A0A4Y8M1C8_9BACL|nr:glycerophosphodiester phosphodiesterase [Cohnella luojiensis]TFE26299.1 glycerophosphodiester phosphodiesterase [Cohnella luojiensis]